MLKLHNVIIFHCADQKSQRGWDLLSPCLENMKNVLTEIFKGLPWWLSGKEVACQSGDTGLIPGSGRSPEEENGSPFQCSCLGNLLDRGHWQTTVHEVLKELDMTDMTEWKFTCLHIRKQICWKCLNSNSKLLKKKKRERKEETKWLNMAKHSLIPGPEIPTAAKKASSYATVGRDSALYNSRGHFLHYVTYVSDAQWWCAMSNPQLWSNSTYCKDPTNYSC